MIEDQILKQVEGLPTLVDKLRFVDEAFPTKSDVLKKAFQEALTLSLKRQFPLFAEQIKPSEPREISGAETYIAIAYQMLHINQYSDLVIKSYLSNPIVSGALQGDSLPKIFNRDRKKWKDNKNKYTELIGYEKPKKSPRPKLSSNVRNIFCNLGIHPSWAEKSFTKKELKHPIAYLDNKIHKFYKRQEKIRSYQKKVI